MSEKDHDNVSAGSTPAQGGECLVSVAERIHGQVIESLSEGDKTAIGLTGQSEFCHPIGKTATQLECSVGGCSAKCFIEIKDALDINPHHLQTGDKICFVVQAYGDTVNISAMDCLERNSFGYLPPSD